jgi:hypothetical protein
VNNTLGAKLTGSTSVRLQNGIGTFDVMLDRIGVNYYFNAFSSDTSITGATLGGPLAIVGGNPSQLVIVQQPVSVPVNVKWTTEPLIALTDDGKLFALLFQIQF